MAEQECPNEITVSNVDQVLQQIKELYETDKTVQVSVDQLGSTAILCLFHVRHTDYGKNLKLLLVNLKKLYKTKVDRRFEKTKQKM